MLRFLTAGESHGPTLTGILEGMPAGLPLSPETIDAELARRQRGFGRGGRMKIESDQVRISAGVLAGKTTGAPIALHIDNLDHEKWRDRAIAPT
jgi:chorismate synthase